MKKTLVNKFIMPVVLGIGLAVSGCTGLGAVMSTSNDPRTRFVGNLMYHESSHQDRIKESRAGRSEVNVYGNTQFRTLTQKETRKNIWTYKIINLDTGKVETEIVNREAFKYLKAKIKENEFAEAGYWMIAQEGICEGIVIFATKGKDNKVYFKEE